MAKRLVQLTLDDARAFAWGGEPIVMDGRPAGEVTSAGYSRMLGRIVAFGYVKSGDRGAPLTDTAVAAARYEIEIAGERFAAEASLKPMYDPKAERVRA